ncbi:RDD family protein [Haloarcula sp. JP-L23]|uniref:RDD family protein n=1 Tax=Haloarcula sp. JP-L23 TaxID=2716717 RepID=UPI00140EDA4A|nr:RDD family protein [Haloarcula sp. JP-L23]
MSSQNPDPASVRDDRVLGFLLDFALLTVATVVVWVVFTGVRMLVTTGGAMGAPTVDSPGTMLGMVALGFALSLLQWAVIGLVVGGYFVYFLTDGGQTLGMRVAGVVLVGEDGGPVTRDQTIQRTAVLLAPLPLMALASVFIPFVGFVLALMLMGGWLTVEALLLFTDDDAQRLGDRIANTLVVESAA